MVREKTEFAFPLDAEEVEGGYDNEYLAEDFARYFRAFLTSGIIADGGNIAESLQVVANDDMTTTLKKGNLIIDGRRYELERDMVFQHRAADGVLDRIDRISITYGTAENDIYANMREGEYSYKPVAPQRRRSSEYMDYVVADVRIVNGAIKITQANITDTRLSTELCGIAFPFWKLDTDPFFAQLNSFYNEFVIKSDRSYDEFLAWAEEKKAEIATWQEKEEAETDAWQKTEENGFTEWKESFIEELESWAHGKMEVWTEEILSWFQNIRDQLTDDPAMHLQEQIGNLSDLQTEEKSDLTAAVNEVNAKSGVTGVKGSAETEYRKGNVNITPDSIGLGNVNNTKDADKNVESAKRLVSRGIVVPETNRTFPTAAGLSMMQAYNNGYPNAYGNVLSIYGQGAGEVFMGWNGKKAPIFYRSIRDTNDPWTEWRQIAFTEDVAPKDSVLKLVETGEFTDDTITLPLRLDASYMLVTREITISTGKVYGYRVRIYATPKKDNVAAPSATNAAASTNAGVTLGTSKISGNAVIYNEDYGITLKASATYRVSYALYEFNNSYGDYYLSGSW